VTTPDGQDTASPTGQLLAAQITILKEVVLRANLPGNLDGLLAQHILGARRLTFDWNVNSMTPEWLADNEHRFAHTHGLAVLGYGLTAFPSSASQIGRQHLTTGLPKLMRKSPFQTDGVTLSTTLARSSASHWPSMPSTTTCHKHASGWPKYSKTPGFNRPQRYSACSRNTRGTSSTHLQASVPRSASPLILSTSPACTGWPPRPRT